MKVYYAGLLRDDKKRAFLAGPYRDAKGADAIVYKAKDAAEEVDPRCFWYTPITIIVDLSEPDKAPAGRLNKQLGLPLSGFCDDAQVPVIEGMLS